VYLNYKFPFTYFLGITDCSVGSQKSLEIFCRFLKPDLHSPDGLPDPSKQHWKYFYPELVKNSHTRCIAYRLHWQIIGSTCHQSNKTSHMTNRYCRWMAVGVIIMQFTTLINVCLQLGNEVTFVWFSHGRLIFCQMLLSS